MKPAFTDDDARFMRLALRLAARGLGNVEPNPLVGAVVVRAGRVVGQGFHRRFGEVHAEVNALRQAGTRARGATLYVTLEPCCHWGKQPPCTDALRAAGVARVIAAMIDPFAPVRGRGVRILRNAGIEVKVDLLEAEARELNRAFIKRVGGGGKRAGAGGRPWVIAKWAQTLDGCVATACGESKWISSQESRRQVHVLRGRMDAIIVGIGTALADDPLLMARPERSRDIRRIATRIVLDSRCRLPLDSQLLRTIPFAPVMVVHNAALDSAARVRQRQLAARGVITMPIRPDRAGHPALGGFLCSLGQLEYANVLVEGGPEIMAAFLRGGHVDEAHIYIAPTLIGGPKARHAVGGADLRRLREATRLEIRGVEPVGPDLHIVARTPADS